MPTERLSIMTASGGRKFNPLVLSEIQNAGDIRATLHAGYDDAFIDRAMPALTVILPSITAGAVQVAERAPVEVLGAVELGRTVLDGIAVLGKIFVDPSHWNAG
jgi:hypothetical protein